MRVTTKTYVIGDTVVSHVLSDTDDILKHRIVIGTIASEWASWNFLAYLRLGSRVFIGCLDGRAVFGSGCFEVVSGLEEVNVTNP